MASTQQDKGLQVHRQIMAKCLILFLNFTSSPPSLRFLTSFALHFYLCYSHPLLSSHPSSLTPVHAVNWNPALPSQSWDPKTGLLQQPQGCSAPRSSMSCQLPPALYTATGQEPPALASLLQQHLPSTGRPSHELYPSIPFPGFLEQLRAAPHQFCCVSVTLPGVT